jgi:hypothetical protein
VKRLSTARILSSKSATVTLTDIVTHLPLSICMFTPEMFNLSVAGRIWFYLQIRLSVLSFDTFFR